MEIFRQITANNINLSEYPFWKELAMEAYLIENEDILKLDNNNFAEVEVLDAEIALKAGRKSGDGRIDILAKYGGEYLSIIELKKDEINEDTLNQLEGYLDQKHQILEFGEYWNEEVEPKWIGVMIGKSICPKLNEKIINGYTYNDIPIAVMTIKRFRSDKSEIFVISDTYFKFNYSNKDYSKFKFNNVNYNKGKLVNAVVRNYVERNPSITFQELKKKFPDHIQGGFGVFILRNSAEKIYEEKGRKRYYIKPDEIIKIEDAVISTCTQWHPVNISKFIKQAEKLNLKIEVE